MHKIEMMSLESVTPKVISVLTHLKRWNEINHSLQVDAWSQDLVGRRSRLLQAFTPGDLCNDTTRLSLIESLINVNKKIHDKKGL